MNWVSSRWLLLPVFWVAASVAVSAAECPLIRPPALSAAQVDAVVAAKAADAEQAQRPIGPNDLGKTLKELDVTGKGIMVYAVFVVSVGEALGFDAAAAFHAGAQARGGKHPFEALSIANYQEISRTQYFAGQDSPPPSAVEDAEYKLQRINVRTPRPAKGWVLVRCDSDYILFQRGSTSSQASTTAGATLVSLQSYKGSEALLSDVRKAATAMMPTPIVRRSVDAGIVEGTSAPCADLHILGTLGEQPYAMHARFCYSAKDSTLGYAALYAQQGRSDLEAIAIEAARFISGASPK